jgi:hypothetical protein
MPTWIFNLDGDRLGVIAVISAPSAELARKKLTRTQRRKIVSVRQFISTKEREAEALEQGLPFPVINGGRSRRKA